MQIDFYISSAESEIGSYSLLAKLVSDLVATNAKILIWVRDNKQAKLIDDVLWSFDDISFIPHAVEPDGRNEPVIISYAEQPELQQANILINLTDQIPTWHKAFPRIIEIVYQDNKTECRRHYKFYKDSEYTVQSHNV